MNCQMQGVLNQKQDAMFYKYCVKLGCDLFYYHPKTCILGHK